MKTNLAIRIGKLKLKNPVLTASGTFGYAEEFKDFIDLRQLGAIVTKTVTLNPRRGNLPARTCETPSGMLNSIGLENPGIELFLKEKLVSLSKIRVPIIVSIASENDPAEFSLLARRLDGINSVAAIELNISCPNMGHRLLVSQDPKATHSVVKSVRKVTGKTLITKLSPNVTDIVQIALAAESAGTDALSLVNTLNGMSVDVKSRLPKIAAGSAGLSGPAIRPVAVKMVWDVYRKIKVPIIGMGGIIDVNSALEFFISGATVVSVGTANFINPRVCIEIIAGIKDYMQDNKISSINKLIGSLKCQN